MRIDIVSDTICPWCYIGKRRLERALAERPGRVREIVWRPFRLAPDMPAEGMAREDYLSTKFGSEEKAAAIYARIAEEGRSEGLDFAFDRIARTPATLDSHRLIRWADSAGCQDAVVEALFAAYFCDGRDISDHTLLARIAADAGMDGALVARLLAEGRDAELVAGEDMAARQAGISGVPTFIFENAYAVSGAQAPELLVRAIDQIAANAPAAAGAEG